MEAVIIFIIMDLCAILFRLPVSLSFGFRFCQILLYPWFVVIMILDKIGKNLAELCVFCVYTAPVS